jgi:hypothetical protein
MTAFGAIPAASGSTVMARPEAFVLGAEGAAAKVVDLLYAGAATVVTLEADGVRAQARTSSAAAPTPGDMVRVTLDPALCVAFD